MKTAVVYWSGTGNTEAMAKAVAEGMTAAGAEAVLLTPDKVQPGDLNAYDAIAFGWRLMNISRSMPSPALTIRDSQPAGTCAL